MSEKLTEDQVEFLQVYYRTKGPQWCAGKLGMVPQMLKYKLKRYREKHGKIEFMAPKPRHHGLYQLPRPIQNQTSCHRWTDIPHGGKAAGGIAGRIIA